MGASVAADAAESIEPHSPSWEGDAAAVVSAVAEW